MSTYHGQRIDWQRISAFARNQNQAQNPNGSWTASGEPTSISCFLGQNRLRKADSFEPPTDAIAFVIDAGELITGSQIEYVDSLLRQFCIGRSFLWSDIRSTVESFRGELPPFGGTYWLGEKPVSLAAFFTTEARLRLASDPQTPAGLRSLMTVDHEASVRIQALVESRTADHAQSPSDESGNSGFFGKLFWIAAIAFLAVGFINARVYEANAETQTPDTAESSQSITYNIVDTKDRICSDGDQYVSCLNMHIQMYNQTCASDYSLSESAQDLCDSLKKWNAKGKKTAKGCGSGCTARSEKGEEWGWTTLKLVPEEVAPTPDEGLFGIQLKECLFLFSDIKLGACPSGTVLKEQTEWLLQLL